LYRLIDDNVCCVLAHFSDFDGFCCQPTLISDSVIRSG